MIGEHLPPHILFEKVDKETIDLVYKVGNTSEGENYSELRYSIRSAVEHFKDLGNIYIIGFKPNWLENVKHINLSDCYTHNKDANLINKLITACNDKELSQRFMNMSDDYYFMKDMKKEDFIEPRYNTKVINTINQKLLNGGKLTKWELRVQRTMNVLLSKGFKANCYETHGPQLLDKTLYPVTLLNYDYGTDNGMCGNTLYYNTIKAEGKQLDDDYLTRLEQKELNINQLENLCSKNYLMNYTANCYNSVMEAYLSQRFPNKTKFETF